MNGSQNTTSKNFETAEASAARSSITDRTVLVTGGAGFIGGHIAARLAGDNDVRILDDLSTGSTDRLPDEVSSSSRATSGMARRSTGQLTVST